MRVFPMTAYIWFALCMLVGVNVGAWAALIFRSPTPLSRAKQIGFRVTAIAITLILATMIGRLRPAGLERGSDGYLGALLLVVGWIGAYWIAKAMLRSRS